MTKPTRPSCLILVPRTPEFRGIHKVLRLAVEGSGEAEAIGLDDSVMYGGVVSEAIARISSTIEKADAIVVDITGANPNIMYELGFAHALKKPVLPIVRRGDANIPEDLQGYLYYVYDDLHVHDWDRQLRYTVVDWLRRTFKGASS